MPVSVVLAQWLALNRRTLQETQSPAVLASFAVEGNPLWLRVAVSECSNLPAWATAPRFPATMAGLLRQVLERLSTEAEHGAVLVDRALGYLACARHGLAEDEVMDVLSADQEVMDDFRRRSPKSPLCDTLPAAVWVRFHGAVVPYLAEREMQGAELLGFAAALLIKQSEQEPAGFRHRVFHRCLSGPPTAQAVRRNIMRKLILSSLFAFAVGIGTAQAQIVIKVRPPKIQVENRGARPSKDHVWVGGYHKWDGNAYGWEKGRWEAPPRPKAVWVAPRYNHTRDGYVFVEGRWR
jgi:hypothetical protein